MSSHLLNEVADVCDEVAMIDHGKLLAYGPLEEITDKFSTVDDSAEAQFSKPIDESINRQISRINNVVSVERIDSRSVRIKYTGGLQSQEYILASLAGMQLGLIGFKSSSTRLEDTYLNLIKETF